MVAAIRCLNLKRLMPDGARGVTRIGQNPGKTDLWVVAVEPQ